MNEAETRAEHIDPALKAAGWGVVEGSRIRREYSITKGRLEGGNGRLGRLLITFLFCGALREPLLYLSLYFKQHRQQYYDLLQSVRLTGDWEAWLRFFLTGVEETANQAGQTAKALMKLAAADEQRIQAIGKLSVPTVTASMKHLAKLGITRETTGRNYGRIYAYDKYLKILNEGTEPLN